MRIGELSDRTGASERMLRYYGEQGLLHPTRTPSGYREYAESDVLRVGHIRCMLGSARPSRVVAQALQYLLDERPPIPAEPQQRARLADVLDGELSALDEKIAALEQSRGQLARFVADVREAQVGPDNPLPVAEQAHLRSPAGVGAAGIRSGS